MANVLSPLSSSGQNRMRSPTKTSVPRGTEHNPNKQLIEPTTFLDETEQFYDVQENFAPGSSSYESDYHSVKASSRERSLSPSKTGRPMRGSPEKNKLTESALRENEGLTRAMNDMDESHGRLSQRTDRSSRSYKGAFDEGDTCVSTFSAVDMTRFAKLSPSKSPTKSGFFEDTPRNGQPTTPGTARHGERGNVSPTPTRPRADTDEATTQLLEFTDHLNYDTHYSPSKAFNTTGPTRQRSPAKQSANLLDFDLPPAPTPRSIPTVTQRELDNLKSDLLSQISSLKATLSGKDAEIQSLSQAKNDAERRIDEECEAKEAAKAEKAELERRNSEIHEVLRDIKSDLIQRDRERDELTERAEAAEKKATEAGEQAAQANSRIAALQAERDALASTSSGGGSSDPQTPNDKAIEVAVEKVARELHQLYKEKHETKVAALKKSYEGRWEKRVRELTTKCEDLQRECEELRVGRDATMSKVVPSNGDDQPKERDEGEVQLLREQLQTLERDGDAAKRENERLSKELESSRKENGELVAAVEQMLQLDPNASFVAGGGADASAASNGHPTPAQQRPPSRPGSGLAFHARAPSGDAGEKPSGLARPTIAGKSGLRGPGFGAAGESRIGGPPGMKRSASGGRSGIMSNIERMGRGRD